MTPVGRKVEKAVEAFNKSEIYLYATQAAFFMIISAVPFAMFLLSLLKFVFPLTNEQMLEMLNASIPNTFEYYFSKVVSDLYTQSSISLVSITAITTLWAASKSTHALALGLNKIYTTSRTKTYLKARLKSIFNTLLLMIALLFSLIIVVFGYQLDEIISSFFPDKFKIIIVILNVKNIISLIVMTFIFTLLYTLLPNKVLKFYHQIPGAFCATICWIGFSYAYSIYIRWLSSFSITYGFLATLVFTMMWVQICMVIFLSSAAINVYLYERKHGYEDHDK